MRYSAPGFHPNSVYTQATQGLEKINFLKFKGGILHVEF